MLGTIDLERLRFDPVYAWKGYEAIWRSTTLKSIASSRGDGSYLSAGAFWAKYRSGEMMRQALESSVRQLEVDNPKAVPIRYSIQNETDRIYLDLAYNEELENISAILSFPLTALHIGWSKVDDLSVLVGMPLKELYLTSCKAILDFEPLSTFENLETLNIEDCAIPNLRCIEDLPAQ